VATLHDFGGVLGRPLDTFFLGSHNFMVTALGVCEVVLSLPSGQRIVVPITSWLRSTKNFKQQSHGYSQYSSSCICS
jgi:hypothetical protein